MESGCDDSPAHVDVEIEVDSATRPDLDMVPRSIAHPTKRPCPDLADDTLKKRVCLENSVTPIYQKPVPRRPCDEDEDEGSDSASVRRVVCSSVDETPDELWDGFSAYVTSCVRSLDSARGRLRVQEDVCAVLQRHLDGGGVEDGRDGPCRRACPACCPSGREEHQDDLEPFLRSMSIVVRRFPERERSELKFKIHELVHQAQMKHLSERKNMQNSPAAL